MSRVLRFLKPTEVEKSLRSACKELLEKLERKHIRIDGKELRGTIPYGKKHAQVQVVSAWLAEENISFGQLQVAKKSNEITAISRLLDELDCESGIITIDAMGYQKAIVEKIIDKKADYVITLKENQKELFQQVSEHIERNKRHLPCYSQLNKERNRGEKRTIYIAKKEAYVEAAQEWKNINTLVLVKSTRLLNNPSCGLQTGLV